jgi:RimJ/RimL family protein N-acetyltransferase
VGRLSARHPLAALLDAAARGSFPPADGKVELLGPPPGRAMAVVGFTAHYVIAAAVEPAWVRERLPPGDLHEPMSPAFLAALAAELRAGEDGLDLVLAAPGLDGPAALTEHDPADHPRVARARAYRDDVRVFASAGGRAVVILGRGLAGRLEVAFELDAEHRGNGLAAAALVEARRLAGPGAVLYAQTAPANVASLKALLTAGFAPIGSEMLFFA